VDGFEYQRTQSRRLSRQKLAEPSKSQNRCYSRNPQRALWLSVALLVGLLGPFKAYQVDPWPRTIGEFLLTLFSVMTAGFTEEFIFRGYFQQQLAILLRSEQWGLISQAILFALAHGFGQTLPGILGKFIAGCLFGWFATRRKNLLPGLIAHCGVNSLAIFLLLWFPQTNSRELGRRTMALIYE